jgi:hypothetical protein
VHDTDPSHNSLIDSCDLGLYPSPSPGSGEETGKLEARAELEAHQEGTSPNWNMLDGMLRGIDERNTLKVALLA